VRNARSVRGERSVQSVLQVAQQKVSPALTELMLEYVSMLFEHSWAGMPLQASGEHFSNGDQRLNGERHFNDLVSFQSPLATCQVEHSHRFMTWCHCSHDRHPHPQTTSLPSSTLLCKRVRESIVCCLACINDKSLLRQKLLFLLVRCPGPAREGACACVGARTHTCVGVGV